MTSEGYDPDLFINENECEKYICAVCLCVMRNACDIGCNEGHNFCDECLTGLANSMSYDHAVSCPLCKQSVPIRYKRPNKFVNRLINELILKECENKCGTTNIKLGEYDTHLERLCPKKYSLCQYNCGFKGLTKYMNDHENGCKLKEFMTKDISTFVDEGKSDFEIASNIKKYFQNIYGPNTVVIVGSSGSIVGYNITYTQPFRRSVQYQGKDILIYQSLVKSNDTRGKIMNQAIFTSFCKGIIMDNENDITKIKKILSDVLKGKYIVMKDAQYEIASNYYCGHCCNVVLNNHRYTCVKIG